MFDITGDLQIERDFYSSGKHIPIITNVSVDGGDVVALGRFVLYEFGYDERVIKIGDEVILGGQSFIIVEKGMGDYFVAVYIRDWSSRIRSRLYRWFKPLTRIKYRVIMTCQIWRLASIPEGAVPLWKNIHVVNKFYSWIKKLEKKWNLKKASMRSAVNLPDS